LTLEVEVDVRTSVNVEFDREPSDSELEALLDSIVGQMSENQILGWINASQYGTTLSCAFKRSFRS